MSVIGIRTKEETKMYNYDVEAFLKEGQEVYGLRGTIEKAVDEVCTNGVSCLLNVFLINILLMIAF